jgi:hypothetical protein
MSFPLQFFSEMEKLGPGDTIDDNEVIAVVIKEMATMLSRYNTCREHLGHM